MTKEERFRIALEFIEADNYMKAFDELCRLHYDFPKDPEIIELCLFVLHRIVEGNYDFEPETAEQFLFRGISKFYKDEIEASIVDYDKALKLNDRLDYVLKCKAFSLTKLGRYNSAIECLYQALQIKEVGEYFDDLGENYTRQGNKERALFCCERAVILSPNDPRLWYNYGTILGKFGQFEKAVQMFDKALAIYPQYEDAVYNRQHYLNRLSS